MPIVRDTDGLALSSRNNLLSLAERKVAISLYNALLEAERLITSGVTDVDIVTNMAKAIIPLDSRLRLEYLEIVDPDELQPVLNIEAPVLIAGSLWVGLTRLIDNVFCVPPSFDYKKRM